MAIFAFNFFDWLGQNQMISGGLVLAAVGTAIASLRKVPGMIYTFIKRKITVTLDIEDSDESFAWVGLWLAQRSVKMRDVSAITRQGNKLNQIGASEITCGKKDNRPKIFLTPAPGTHFLWYHGRLMIVYRKRQEGSKGQGGLLGGGAAIMKTEGYVITFLSRNADLPRMLLEDARNVALPEDGKIDVRVSQTKWYGDWQLVDRIRPRSIESVILAGNEHLKILADINDFLSSYDWYVNLGIPYRRGYLCHGEPGNGKTSLVAAIASALGMNIYILSLQAEGMTDSLLMELLNGVSDNSIILMEDVDCAFKKRVKNNNEEKEDIKNKLTFSGLLNALDGVGGKDGRIVFMTTNHIEKLDPALIRPGRIDYQVQIKNANREQVTKLFDRFYVNWKIDPELRKCFIDSIPDYKYSMAKIQGFLMCHKENPWGLVAYREELDKTEDVFDDKEMEDDETVTPVVYQLTGLKNKDTEKDASSH